MSLSAEVIAKYRQAGKIAAEVRELMRHAVREGMPIISICEKTEASIREKGGKPAFPCNVSINELAAHYTSPPNDKRTVPLGSLVKVDIGVHVDGYIADTAVTVCFNREFDNLVSAAEDALDTGVKTIRPGLFTSQFGSAIQRNIESHGLKPIANLTGHQVARYLIHAGRSLPNVTHISTSRIASNEVYAIEPFVTVKSAAGRVETGKEAHIFRFVKQKKLKSEFAKKLCDFILENFRTLPFAERWLQSVVPLDKHKSAFSELLASKTLMAYPVFIEVSGKPVAQAEHTVLVTKNGCEVLT
ncbi:MAG TPA: type II methionyl aminopeptidase [Candidatus Bathyarchaeia archaeon]|nr:type II methionyl aminopeptidase [Candidatus Bathyarchaeia archaeon]